MGHGSRRGHGGRAQRPSGTARTARSRWPSAAEWRSSAISSFPRTHRQLTGRLPRHRPPARGVAGTRHRDPVRSAGGTGLLLRRPGRRRGRASGPHRRARPPSPPAPTPRWSSWWCLPSGTRHWSQALERRGVTVRDGVDLVCETGAGRRTVLVRAGSLRPDGIPPSTPRPPTTGRGWPAWSAWTTRDWHVASSPHACCTGGCAATSGRRRSRWP